MNEAGTGRAPVVRPAVPDDASALARLSGEPLAVVAERLDLGGGPDHLVLVALGDGGAVAYAVVGGAVGQSAKGDAQLYDFTVGPDATAAAAGSLLEAVLTAARDAEYAGVRLAPPRAGPEIVRLALARGFVPVGISEGCPMLRLGWHAGRTVQPGGRYRAVTILEVTDEQAGSKGAGMDDIFQVTLEQRPEGFVVSAAGEIDVSTAPDLRERLNDLPDDIDCVVIDLSEVTFLDSTGLGVLIAAHKRLRDGPAHGTVRLVVTRPQIEKVLEVTGLTAVFPIYPTVELAVGS